MSKNQQYPLIFDNITNKVIDDLNSTIKKGSKISIAAASFSLYAFQTLKKELEKIDELRFIFTGDVFTKEKGKKEAREFYIPRLHYERALYGTDFELKLRNELCQSAIAKECAKWIKSKVKFCANISGEFMSPFMTLKNADEEVAYSPFSNFTTAELGLDRGNNAYTTTTKLPAPHGKQFFDTFEQIWNDKSRLKDVTSVVLDNITAAYKENSPEMIYFLSLYNIFKEFLENLNEDFLPNEATGFKQSKIWKMLYDFQRDAVLGCIAKLEKHNGCILADSVGLGKTFSALGVIKYYEARNKNVLVLCPKRLTDNWNTFKHNYKNNPIAADRLRYDVLFHTDLLRERGDSNGIDLQRISWENYDLLVIDESHNFRNGSEVKTLDDGAEVENRYHRLMYKVINKGVKTKVLMLSATPVNTDFADLRNQLMLACEGNSTTLTNTLKTKLSVDEIFHQAQTAFNDWSKLTPNERTTGKLLESLHFDFFELLDSVSIARSRKHIEKYYDSSKIGKFPQRLKPISHYPDLTDVEGIDFNSIYDSIQKLNLCIYTPLKFVFSSQTHKYTAKTDRGSSWENRELGRLYLMDTNLLKRLESSVYAFRKTVERLYDLIDSTLGMIEKYKSGRAAEIETVNFDSEDFDEDEMAVGKKQKINLADMDTVRWKTKLAEDKLVLDKLLETIRAITPEHDLKLKKLEEAIRSKEQNPINQGNKKVLLFTAFADTATYLYDYLSEQTDKLTFALVTGNTPVKTTLPNARGFDFNDVLTCFSPVSKDRGRLFKANPGDIDILIATDCVSEGQNLQDCDYLVNYDIHWNPVRIIQRFGRIDRIGSKNEQIQLVNFWPNISLDSYIKLKDRVKNRFEIGGLTSAGREGNVIDDKIDPELDYRKKQLERLKEEVVDLEEMDSGISIIDLGLNEFHLDLQQLLSKYGEADGMPFGVHAVAQSGSEVPKGVIFILKNRNNAMNIDKQNRLHPFYMVYMSESGDTITNHLNPKALLNKLRLACKGKDKPLKSLVARFNRETNDGKNMAKYSELLGKAVHSIMTVTEERDIDSLFSAGETTALAGKVKGLNDFELIDFLVIC
ncbi:MAG: DEAD/DEAH box helicase family protein [Prevotellaceae bacterium]|jgi:SNF2 family DNA or RNA helicase|nr:DEAD/DEAH box helicase family protein [Prevotellaceae bacterium]